jgi:hypothetical protein
MKKTMRNTVLAAIGGVLAGMMPMAAHADLIDGIVDVWTVDVSAIFKNAVFDPNATGTTVTPTSLRWGTAQTAAGQSGLDLTNTPISTQVTTNGGAVANIGATHLNHVIQGNSLDTVDIESTLVLTPFIPGGSGLPSQTLVFHVNFTETTNNLNPCPNGLPNNSGVNVNGCADIFVIDQTSLNFPFLYDLGTGQGQKQYFISFFEQTNGLNSLPTAACTAAGASSPCLGFMTPESQDTAFRFAALITTVEVTPHGDVPEPGMILLAATSLLAAGFARRFRKS